MSTLNNCVKLLFLNFCCRLDAALDLEYDVTKQYTGSYFEEEIKGLADASGADEKTIRRIHMIGELTYVQQEF